MIKGLRENEEVILYANRPAISENEKIKVVNFLRKEYERESLEFPLQTPLFNEEAALWSAEFVYLTAQFILYRKDHDEKLDDLFPKLERGVDAGSVLSVDLCFRFIPDMLLELKHINTEDPVIKILENQLQKWHYSGIKYSLDVDALDLDWIFPNRCIRQLYLDRIVAHKNLRLAKNTKLHPHLKANLSIFDETYWMDFKLISVNE